MTALSRIIEEAEELRAEWLVQYLRSAEAARECAKVEEADRLAAVRAISTKALHDIILAVLDAFDGCCLDTDAERERVAAGLVAVLAAL